MAKKIAPKKPAKTRPGLKRGNQGDGGGQPTKYREEYCDMLVKHMAEGGSFESFAAIVDAGVSTLWVWTEAHPMFLDAKLRGEPKAYKWHEDLAKAMATGSLRSVKSETKLEDGTIKKEYTPTRGDSKVWGITMRARFRKFGYANHLEVTGAGGGPIRTKEEEMTDEELDKELDKLEKQGV